MNQYLRNALFEKKFWCLTKGVLMYDNIYPTRLNGSDIDGQEISLNVCPGENFKDEVSTFFPPSEVKSIINV